MTTALWSEVLDVKVTSHEGAVLIALHTGEDVLHGPGLLEGATTRVVLTRDQALNLLLSLGRGLGIELEDAGK